MTSQSTFVLVHGAWHNPECFHKVTSGLSKLGYTVIGVRLPSTGSEPPVTSIDADIQVIHSTVAAEVTKGSDVVVVTHSYSGLPASAGLSGLLKPDRLEAGQKGGVVAIAMIASGVLLEGERASDHSAHELPIVVAEDGTGSMGKEDAIAAFYNDVEREEAEYWWSTLKPQAMVVFMAPLPGRMAWRDVPLHYLVCDNDQALFPQQQHEMADRCKKEKGGEGVIKEVCSSGHSPFLSMPETVIGFLRRAAGESV